jgi:hypothetical protein
LLFKGGFAFLTDELEYDNVLPPPPPPQQAVDPNLVRNCLIAFTDPKTQIGLTVGIFFVSIVVLLIPHVLIGGCGMMSMVCRRVAFPALNAIGIFVLIGSVANLVKYS